MTIAFPLTPNYLGPKINGLHKLLYFRTGQTVLFLKQRHGILGELNPILVTEAAGHSSYPLSAREERAGGHKAPGEVSVTLVQAEKNLAHYEGTHRRMTLVARQSSEIGGVS